MDRTHAAPVLERVPAPAAAPALRGRDDDDHLIAEPLFMKGGGLHLRLCGQEVALLNGGAPVARFEPGWRAAALFTGFAPLFLLELAHEDGRRATWFHDYRMNRVGGAAEELAPDLAALLRLRAVPLLRALADEVLDRCEPALPAPLRAFLGVNEATRQAIAAACPDPLVRRPAIYRTEDLMPRALAYRGDDGRLRTIDRDRLAEGLEQPWQDRLARAARGGGPVEWPSPVDGAPLPIQGSLVFDDFHFAYRVADHRHRLVFFVLTGDHLARVAGLWFPAMGLLAVHNDEQAQLGALLADRLPGWVVPHALRWAGQLVPYLRHGADHLASVMRARPGAHIGHHLWNELSGIDQMVRDEPAGLPRWIVLGADRATEFYGPVDALFPEVAGRVDRHLGSHADLAQHAYARRALVVRVTREHVSAGLRRRILALAERSASGEAVAQRVRALGPVRVILVGLRVENRTLDDLPGFLAALAAFVAARHPGAAIVLDGHNGTGLGDGRDLGSHGDGLARRPPIDVERELVAGVRAACAGLPLTVIDTVGAPMAESLAWAAASTAFVSIWGASLAKFRWACNRPGFVLSNRTNLLHREALHIYASPRYMEQPAPLAFVDPALVSDAPDSPQLVPVAPGDPGYHNFRLDVAGALAAFGAFLRQVTGEPGAAA